MHLEEGAHDDNEDEHGDTVPANLRLTKAKSYDRRLAKERTLFRKTSVEMP